MLKTTYDNCKTLIAAGRYRIDDMMMKLDLFLMVGRITADQYIELSGLMAPPEETPAEIPTEAPTETQ